MNTICIMCPMGCPLTITETESGIKVEGNTCKRGEIYGKQEYTCPQRVVTSLVATDDGRVVSVKTSGLVDKDKIFDILKVLKGITIKTPVATGDCIIANVCDSGADIIATSSL